MIKEVSKTREKTKPKAKERMETIHFNVTYADGYYSAHCKDFSASTQAKTINQLMKNIKEVYVLYYKPKKPVDNILSIMVNVPFSAL